MYVLIKLIETYQSESTEKKVYIIQLYIYYQFNLRFN